MTIRSVTTLADGRELIYYDRSPGATHVAKDLRELPRITARSQTRWDPLFEDYTVIAGHRQTRTYRPAEDACPLCPSAEGRQSEIPDTDYEVVVFENRFPAFSSAISPHALGSEDWSAIPALGRCEVLCFTSDHELSLSQLPPHRVRTVVDAWADRTAELSAREDIAYVSCFENRGQDIGVTLSHSHGQIYGYPFVPPRFGRAGRTAQRYHDESGDCLQCHQLHSELQAGDRIVADHGDWVAYVPYAARWPYELRLVPRQHVASLPDLDDDQREELAVAYLDTLQRFDQLFDTPTPYIAAWLQTPFPDARTGWHLAAEIFTIRRSADRVKYLAGAESSAGTWINDITPEDAAIRLREGRSPDTGPRELAHLRRRGPSQVV